MFPGAAGFTAVPPAGETRFVSTEMVFHVGPNVSRQTVDATAARLGVTVVGVQASGITGGTLYHFRLPPGRQVSDVVRSLETERVGIPSPNYVYRIVQDTASDTSSSAGTPEQYTIEKLQLAEVHKVATGRDVLVAVIDSKVDVNHPDLADAIVEHYDAVGRQEQAHSHGTGMAGAIVSHRKLLGIAPGARILAVHAFSTSTRQSPEATTRQIIAGIEWAINKGARIINMSFAGPYDPMIQLAMRNAAAKGVILIAASGNMGAKSPPLYPAADPHVIAVTATDEATPCSRRPCAGRMSRSRRQASTWWCPPRTTPISSPPARRLPPRMSAVSRRCCWSAIRRSMRGPCSRSSPRPRATSTPRAATTCTAGV